MAAQFAEDDAVTAGELFVQVGHDKGYVVLKMLGINSILSLIGSGQTFTQIALTSTDASKLAEIIRRNAEKR